MPMSLSPRPERLTMRILSRPILGARLMASAMACADSSAGMMPSVRASSLAASSASASVARGVLGAAGVVQPGVLGADGGVVEAGGDGVRQRDLAVVVLQHVAVGAVQHAGQPAGEARGVLAECSAAAAGFDADQFDVASSMKARRRRRWHCEPPPTQATMASGRRPSRSRIWRWLRRR